MKKRRRGQSGAGRLVGLALLVAMFERLVPGLNGPARRTRAGPLPESLPGCKGHYQRLWKTTQLIG